MGELELIRRAQAGDERAADRLVRRYREKAYHAAGDFYLPDGDRHDVRQEALLGLVKAIRDYRPERGPFGAFVYLCVRRQLIVAVKTANRGKNLVLTGALRELPDPDDHGRPMRDAVDVIPDRRGDVARRVASRDELRRLLARLDELSPVERRCLAGLAAGYSYDEIGEPFKRADNAVQRARRKLREAA